MKAVAAVLHWPVRRPVVTLLLVGLLGCAAAGLVRRLEPDVTLEAMTGAGQRSADVLSRVLHHYAAAEQLLLLASLPPTTKGPDPDRLLR
ncbi:MAG TPA: hypothetical protein VNL70_08595, partial [Tepidisphaeraceae bacterium]|nr:hypothetical protein [Tepidisphaeraceae bacterium]